MAPGVVQNSETIINDTLIVNGNGNIINELVDSVKTCPVALPCSKPKPVRRVIRPKVLKNHESREYLYDRLYDTTCPRVVSGNSY